MEDGEIPQTSSQAISSSSPSKSTESKRNRRRRERREALTRESQSGANTSGGPSGISTPNNNEMDLAQVGPSRDGVKDGVVAVGGFDPNEDYIAFDFDSAEDLSYVDDAGTSSRNRDRKGKEKEKGKEKGGDSGYARSREDDRDDRSSKRRRERSSSEGDFPSRDREWERRSRTVDKADERDRDRSSRKDKDRHRDGRHKMDERLDKRDRYDRRDRDRSNGRYRDEVREERRERDRSKERRRRKEKERSSDKGKDNVREWDRGKEAHRDIDRRKYEMVFDVSDGYANKKQRMDASSRKCPWAVNVDWDSCRNVAEMLHKEVEAFTKWIGPSPVEDEIRGLVVTLITRAVVKSFADATVSPFGSYETKLYLPLGDIDLVIMSNSMAWSNRVTVLQSLANTLRRAGITDRVTVISKAKVPIIKFITTHGRFNVDISINQENGIRSGKIINGFLNDMHGTGLRADQNLALRSLVLATKAFLSQRGMNEVFTGGLGSYSIVCLAVSFLQMHPKLRRGEIDPNMNLGVLLVEFFELYGCYFNYEEVGISLRDGGMYFNKKKRGWHSYENVGLLSIEDPAEFSNDISRGSYGFSKVRTTLAGAYEILKSTLYLKAGILAARREGRAFRLHTEPDPAEMSILSSIMGVTQEAVNHRRLTQELYDKRVLHRLLGVQPQPEVVLSNGTGSSPISISPSTSRQDNIAAVYGKEGDHKRHHSDIEDGGKEEEDQLDEIDEEDEGRYSIGREPPTKRQRTRTFPVYTEYSSDDEDEKELNSEAEEAHYASPSDTEEENNASNSKPASKLSNGQRRSYWASKSTTSLGED